MLRSLHIASFIRGLEEAMRIAERERDDLYRSRDTRGMQQITAHGADVVVRALGARVERERARQRELQPRAVAALARTKGG